VPSAGNSFIVFPNASSTSIPTQVKSIFFSGDGIVKVSCQW
jgi:hypothetical protein